MLVVKGMVGLVRQVIKNNWVYIAILLATIFVCLSPKEKPVQEVKYTIVKQEILVENPKFETVVATAYTAGYESTQKKKGQDGFGVTASGNLAKEGRTIACPKSLPFGTEVYVPDMNKVYVCEDRGGAITNGHIDIYFEELSVAKKFGKKKLEVLVNIPKVVK